MQEVTIRLRFTRESLGASKRQTRRGRTIFRMLRSPSDQVLFLATWWAELMRYAARVANLQHKLAAEIDWDQNVDGVTRDDWRRYVATSSGRPRYSLHEAFPPGAVIGVNAVLPSGLSIDELTRLLELAGTYRGISPFKSETERYGTFDVVSVMPTRINKMAPADSRETGRGAIDSTARTSD